MELLGQFKQEQDAEIQRIGSKWEDHDRLFTKWNGAPMNPQTPFEWLQGYCERIGVPFKNIHSLRHLLYMPLAEPQLHGLKTAL